jgi:hypothetical protein
MRTLRISFFFLIAVAMSLGALAQPSNYTFTKIADLNDYAGYFEPATLINRGEVLFAPAMQSGGEGVLLWRRGSVTTVAAGGQLMPVPDGGVLGYTLSPIAMSDNGEAAFVMTRNGIDFVPSPTGFNAGVYRYNSRTGIVPVMVPGVKQEGGDGFWGSYFVSSINNSGELVFSGMFCTGFLGSVGTIGCPDGSSKYLAIGVYKADGKGVITPVVLPGDPAPVWQGNTFDLVRRPVINARGDVAFTAHVSGELCLNADILVCSDSLFVKRRPSGTVEEIARVGKLSPIPGKYYASAFGPILNAKGDVAFVADVSANADGSDVAVFLYTGGKTIVIAKRGDPMPGGGTFMTGGYYGQDSCLNNQGDVVFDATLSDGTNAIYVWRKGIVSLVAKTGTDTGAGVISTLDDFGGSVANTQVSINDSGQILFAAKFKAGGGAMLVATPKTPWM